MTQLELSITEQIDYETFVKIISNIPSCIFFKDVDLKYRFSSHCWAQLISDDIVGKTDLDIRKDKENAIKAMEADRAIIESRKGCSYVIKSDIDGEISYLELIKEPIINSQGKVLGIVGLINDVTEKTIMEKKIVGMSEMLEVKCSELETSNDRLQDTLNKVEKMNAAQKMFTASMNHELRSPLNGIIGNLQLLMEDERLHPDLIDNVKGAYLSSQMMLEIVNELLDFAKLELSKISIKKESFSIQDVIENIDYIASIQAKEKNLDFSTIVDENICDYYIGDKKRITQIMNNLVSNAIKYTEKGFVRLNLSYVDNNLVIICKDTGQGIAKDSIDSLFDPFVRFNEARNANIQGTGLGLSVVKKLIDIMGGEIYVDSILDEGTTFIVSIPIEEDKNRALLNNDTSTVNDVEYGKYRVLCIDDSMVNAKVLSSLLRKCGSEADVAYNAHEGIKRADSIKYDVIFLDHLMPEMDGIEAFHNIRNHSLLNSETPIIIMTGNADSSYGELYKEHGIDGWLVKPATKEQIMDIINQVIK